MGLTKPATVGAPVARDLTVGLTKRGLDLRGKLVEVALVTLLALSMFVLITLIVELLVRSWSLWTDRPWDFITTNLNAQNAAAAGIGQAVRGTLVLCVIVMLVAFPLGVACGVYLEEYANKGLLARLIRVNVRNLAGVPSIVYGLLGLAVFVKLLSGINNGRNIFTGGLALSVLVLPIVVITSSEALRAVPRSIREGALGVGATQWETIRSHVLPAAAPGILTGTVLSLARAAGEAAPILLVGAATGLLRTGNQGVWEQLQGPFTAMPVAIFSYARQPGADFRAITAAASLVLLVLVLLMNAVAIALRNRYEKKW